MKPILSIVIPTLNEELYLPKLLSDIKNQTYKSYEIIVSDGSSKDYTLKIAKIFKCRTVTSKKRSEFTQRNNGARIAKGKYFLFLDADNRLYSKNFLQNSVLFFEDKKLSIAGFKLKYDSDKFKYKIASHFYNLISTVIKYIHPLTMTGIMTTKKLHNSVGGFDENESLGGDHIYSKSLSKLGKYGRITNVTLNTSVRRFDKEGLLNVHIKWLKALIYYFLPGKDRKSIKYEFGKF